MMRKPLILWLSLGLLSTSGCAMKETQAAASPADSALANPYLPDRSSDPHARKAWDDGIKALEAQCRKTGRYCEEAEAGRAALRKL